MIPLVCMYIGVAVALLAMVWAYAHPESPQPPLWAYGVLGLLVTFAAAVGVGVLIRRFA